jgi:hypothetical protein
VDKERSNFCEYFALGTPGRRPGARTEGGDGAARRALDELFRKS